MAKYNHWVHVHPDEYEPGASLRLMNYGTEGEDTPVILIGHTSTNDVDGDLVGEANYKWFEANASDKVIFVHGGHGYKQVAIRADVEPAEEVQEAIDSLESYPLLDEELHSELEMEAETEAWDDWGIQDFNKVLTKLLVEQGYDADQVEELLESKDEPIRAAYSDLIYKLKDRDPGHSEGDSWSFPFSYWKQAIERDPTLLAPLIDLLTGGVEPPEWLRPL